MKLKLKKILKEDINLVDKMKLRMKDYLKEKISNKKII